VLGVPVTVTTVAAGSIVCVKTELVEPEKLVSPPYAAVIE
jgi:hypothetical protein